MNKSPLTTIVTHLLRGASFILLLFITIPMIQLAQGQPQNSKSSINSETSPNGVRGPVGTRTVVKVHDNVERAQVASPQQNQTVLNPGPPSGTICGVESRAAHGQPAPNTNGGTLNPVAF